MNIKEVLDLPNKTLVGWNKNNEKFRVHLTDDGARFLDLEKPSELDQELDYILIDDKYTLMDIIHADFKIIDERPRYNFYSVLHLNEESPNGVSILIGEAIKGKCIDSEFEDSFKHPMSVGKALANMSLILKDDVLTDILLNDTNFIVEENE